MFGERRIRNDSGIDLWLPSALERNRVVGMTIIADEVGVYHSNDAKQPPELISGVLGLYRATVTGPRARSKLKMLGSLNTLVRPARPAIKSHLSTKILCIIIKYMN